MNTKQTLTIEIDEGTHAWLKNEADKRRAAGAAGVTIEEMASVVLTMAGYGLCGCIWRFRTLPEYSFWNYR